MIAILVSLLENEIIGIFVQTFMIYYLLCDVD